MRYQLSWYNVQYHVNIELLHWIHGVERILSMEFRRQQTQHKDILTSSLPTRMERQTTNIFSQRSLPTVINDTGQRWKLEVQRQTSLFLFFETGFLR